HLGGLVRPAGVNVHDNSVIRVDEVVVGIGKECCPLTGGIGMGGELGFIGVVMLTACTKRSRTLGISSCLCDGIPSVKCFEAVIPD
ncbi:MAG: hypothetical protein ABJH33_03985, partial [Rhizobiaceae bacterium]